jgi:hypothetical protein
MAGAIPKSVLNMEALIYLWTQLPKPGQAVIVPWKKMHHNHIATNLLPSAFHVVPSQ